LFSRDGYLLIFFFNGFLLFGKFRLFGWRLRNYNRFCVFYFNCALFLSLFGSFGRFGFRFKFRGSLLSFFQSRFTLWSLCSRLFFSLRSSSPLSGRRCRFSRNWSCFWFLGKFEFFRRWRCFWFLPRLTLCRFGLFRFYFRFCLLFGRSRFGFSRFWLLFSGFNFFSNCLSFL